MLPWRMHIPPSLSSSPPKTGVCLDLRPGSPPTTITPRHSPFQPQLPLAMVTMKPLNNPPHSRLLTSVDYCNQQPHSAAPASRPSLALQGHCIFSTKDSSSADWVVKMVGSDLRLLLLTCLCLTQTTLSGALVIWMRQPSPLAPPGSQVRCLENPSACILSLSTGLPRTPPTRHNRESISPPWRLAPHPVPLAVVLTQMREHLSKCGHARNIE